MYRLIVETLLGLKVEVDQMRLAPLLPSAWESFKMHYHYRDTFYHITITRLAPDSAEPNQLLLDGSEIEGGTVPLVDDRLEHVVEMKIR